ncbi:uncharacterized protein SPAPADRAFT_62486 [Spathaspora passalidarum NRRL Y-27907]|uniref:Uncharacterized protein n=1 Tax=Spathaspora passalidarum (strain NRRL Y-27907 / 11-Y1) TaxID=619300 RepID=G3AS30_SPAPN|nr:uncharacterized protein SPAPADRAFT_62486 [Spathaspora passalidarum NRRL Y-27907]EGW31879.1 hypothetical protein SPAPADRAFT_62486 [Spathaspora passalidarum NRRL Y-27907]
MSNDWAAKLAISSSKSTNIPPQNSQNANKPKRKQSTPPSSGSSNKPTPEVESRFNSSEVLDYLNSNHTKYLQLAKQDKEGEQVKIYRSLEASSQWTTTTKPVNPSGKYNAKDVIRNKSGTTNNTLDLLFEINRSIYQQKESR